MTTRFRISITWARAAVAFALVWGAGCAHAPASFRDKGDGIAAGDTLAVLPLVNLSLQQNAPDVVMNALVVELLDLGAFQVKDPGDVQRMVLEKRLRLTDRLPTEALHEVEADLGVKYVMEGTVNGFGMVNEGGDTYPSVSITLRMVRCSDGRIVWAGSHSKRGDDSESVFGLGRVGTLEQLTQITVSELVDTLQEKKR